MPALKRKDLQSLQGRRIAWNLEPQVFTVAGLEETIKTLKGVKSEATETPDLLIVADEKVKLSGLGETVVLGETDFLHLSLKLLHWDQESMQSTVNPQTALPREEIPGVPYNAQRPADRHPVPVSSPGRF